MAVLRLLRGLEEVDLRGNPFTVGFYNPGVMREVAIRADIKAKVSKNKNEGKGEDGVPMQDREMDKEYLARLDEDTRLRRRVYEMLCVSSCSRLRVLDGLEVRKEDVLVKDGVWRRLVELGIVKKCEG